jgi:RNA polymerase sigma-70 factor (ECF subfamily)
LEVDPDAYTAFVRARIGAEEDPDTIVPRLAAADLYLACATLEENPAAVAALRTLVEDVVRKLPAIEGRPETRDELAQALICKLLASDPPKLAEYGGRGSLSAWLRVVALRMGHDVHRAEWRHVPYEATLAERALAEATDPELEYIKGRYLAPLHAAFTDALHALPREERLLLRLHYVDGMAVEALGEARGWSRRTVYRRLEEARALLFGESCRLLRERLEIRPDELESLIGLLHSRIQASVFTFLRATPT